MLKRVKDQEVELDCQFRDVGILCGRLGTIAVTIGGSGPWYCRDHAWVVLHDERVAVTPKVANVRTEAKQFCEDRGLNTIDAMRSWVASKVHYIGGREPGQEG